MAPRAAPARRRPFAALRPGDVVDVVAPGSRCADADLEAALDVLRSWGLEPRVPDDLFGETPFTAHTEAVRWRQMRRALESPESRAVWCVRGGYGAFHLAAHIARAPQPAVPKPIIGFSDATALLYAVNHCFGWDVVHGPVLSQLGSGKVAKPDIAKLKSLLFGRAETFRFGNLERVGERPARNRTPVLEGRLAGGNLATLQSLTGSLISPRLRGRIVVLEDVSERGYEIDRLLYGLQAAGAFAGVRAFVCGTFTGGDEPDGSNLTDAALAAFAARAPAPVFKGMPVGHGPRLAPLVLGAPAELTIARNGRARLEFSVTRA